MESNSSRISASLAAMRGSFESICDVTVNLFVGLVVNIGVLWPSLQLLGK